MGLLRNPTSKSYAYRLQILTSAIKIISIISSSILVSVFSFWGLLTLSNIIFDIFPFNSDSQDIFTFSLQCVLIISVLSYSPSFFGLQLYDTVKIIKEKYLLCTLPLIIVLIVINIIDLPNFDISSLQLCILSPIIEEIIFRGICFSISLHLLSNITSKESASAFTIISSSCAFSFSHLINIYSLTNSFVLFQMVYTFVYGLYFGYLKFKSNSLLLPTMIHIIINTSVYLK